METKIIRNRVFPILVLFILSPVIAELLSGSTPLSRSYALIIESLFYGSAALLIRDLVRRNKLAWISVLFMGIAFGIFEEGLLTHSIFNEHFMNFSIGLGRLWGVNWVWAEIIVGNHAIYSITLPILLTELIFRDRNSEPWLSKIGIVIALVLFALGSLAIYSIFNKMYPFSASLISYFAAFIIIMGFIFAAFKIAPKLSFTYTLKSPPPLLAGLFSLIASFSWLILLSLIFKNDLGLHSWIIELTGIAIVFIIFFVLTGWGNSKWSDIYRLYLTSGTIYSGMIFGLIILIPTNNKLDIYGQLILILLMTILLISLRKKLVKN